MHMCARGADATAPWSGKSNHRQVHTPQALRSAAMCDIFSAAGIHISSYHRGNLILYCRSTWTQTTPRVWHPPRSLVHTLHPCKDTELRSWHLQIFWVRARSKPSSTIAYRERRIQSCIAEARSELVVACAASILAARLGTCPHTPRPTTPRTRSDTSWSRPPRQGDSPPNTPRGNQPRPPGRQSWKCGTGNEAPRWA